MLHHAFRLASIVEGAACAGVSIPSPQSPLDDYRLEPGAEIKTLPDAVRAWWEVNRGWVRVTCSRHGVLIRTETTRTPPMLAALWDGAVIEHGTQKEHVWSSTVEHAWRVAQQGPDSTICDVRLESEQNPLATFPVVPRNGGGHTGSRDSKAVLGKSSLGESALAAPAAVVYEHTAYSVTSPQVKSHVSCKRANRSHAAVRSGLLLRRVA
jgi:hypothetical protein